MAKSDLGKQIAREARKAVVVQSEKQLKKAGRAFANEVAEYAQDIAPVDEGDYRKSIKVRGKGKRGRLPWFEVYSDDPKAHLIEHGTIDTPDFNTFGRTAFHYRDMLRGDE